MTKAKRVEILNLSFDVLELDELNNIVLEGIREQKKIFIANHNLHSTFLFNHDEDFKKAYDLADYVHADGMPLILWARLMGYKVSRRNRIAYLDWYESLFGCLDKMGIRLFYLGGMEHVTLKAIDKLKRLFPNIAFTMHGGYFSTDGEENKLVIEQIRSANPQVLLVGMGMPRQEKWISDNFEKLPHSVIFPCGAFFDYIAGAVRPPPRWLSGFYLEWFFRFVFEPRRLFKRYFIEPIYLVPIFGRDLVKKFFIGIRK